MNSNFSRALALALLSSALLMADVPVVPELDPGSASSALAILAGIGLVLRSRKRR